MAKCSARKEIGYFCGMISIGSGVFGVTRRWDEAVQECGRFSRMAGHGRDETRRLARWKMGRGNLVYQS